MKKIFLALSVAAFFTACTTNAVTGRKQLSLISNEQLQADAAEQYRGFLSQNRVASPSNNRDAEMVRRVGSRIANAITSYYNGQGKGEVLSGYQWEFSLIDGKDANAWAMPGGKVAVYTGLLPITQNEAALAVVLGHEITHAVAQHTNEMISKQYVAQAVGGVVGAAAKSNIFNQVYGLGSGVYGLKNSRNAEYEADHFGLLFTAMAGYNPQEAINFWNRMSAAKEGNGAPPEFLSTHPADGNRIARLQGHMKEALSYYKPVRK
jgi:predicted Zn-dependent protease